MISTKGRYALRTMVDIAQQKDEGFVSLRDIAQRQGISMKYLEQIVGQLTRAGLVKSSRGAQGGYRLARSPQEYTAGDILRVTEGELAPVACLAAGARTCERGEACATVEFWRGLQQVIETYLDGVTLAQLAQSGQEGEQPQPSPKKPLEKKGRKKEAKGKKADASATNEQKGQEESEEEKPVLRRAVTDIPIELL